MRIPWTVIERLEEQELLPGWLNLRNLRRRAIIEKPLLPYGLKLGNRERWAG